MVANSKTNSETAAMELSIGTSAVAALSALQNGDVSAFDLTSHFLAHIKAGNAGISAVRHVLAEQAFDAARLGDKKRQSGGHIPPLAGLPVLVKENCDTAGAPCSAGLPFRKNHIPSMDSSITARLKAAGAIVLGVAVSDPGAFGVRTLEVTNPLDPTLTVGGSSGGSAAALAAGFCLGAIGTDTGGSVRIPSACCGTVGLKPTYNALPMDGIFPLIPSLDHVGPMARSVEDVALLWSALSQSKPIAATPVRKIGYDPVWLHEADLDIRLAFGQLLKHLEALGIECVEIDLPDLDEVSQMHGSIFFVEGAAYHYAHHKKDIHNYPQIARDWFELAIKSPVSNYVAACEKRVQFTNQVNQLLEQVDVILTPTIPASRPRRDATMLMIAGEPCDFTMALVRQTCLFNHTGHPALAMPIGASLERPPASIQIIGRHRGEDSMLNFAGDIETGQMTALC
jgi:Asp-tRNA(Asn)/Glu-tRNA(Gln) amidotransferase A subunit family amidase